jgi:hypothetical protein
LDDGIGLYFGVTRRDNPLRAFFTAFFFVGCAALWAYAATAARSVPNAKRNCPVK